MKRVTLLAMGCLVSGCITVQAPPQQTQPQIVYLPAPTQAPLPTAPPAASESKTLTPKEREEFIGWASTCAMAYKIAQNEFEKTGDLEQATWVRTHYEWWLDFLRLAEPSEQEAKDGADRALDYIVAADKDTAGQLGAACLKVYEENQNS